VDKELRNDLVVLCSLIIGSDHPEPPPPPAAADVTQTWELAGAQPLCGAEPTHIHTCTQTWELARVQSLCAHTHSGSRARLAYMHAGGGCS